MTPAHGGGDGKALHVRCDPDRLVEAIDQANTRAVTRIVLAKGCTYSIGSERQGNALPAMLQRITIDGNGATIKRASTAGNFRIMEVETGGALTLHHLTLTGGHAAPGSGGGAVLVQKGGNLTLDKVTLKGNSGGDGSSANGGAIANSGVTHIARSLLADNTAYDGGAVYSDASGALTVVESRLLRNVATNTGGALHLQGRSVVEGSALNNNRANGTSGGAIYNFGGANLDVIGSVVDGNQAADDGGGIMNKGASILTLRRTTVSNNTAHVFGGGLYIEGNALLEDSKVQNNTATIADGGGIYINVAQEVALRRSHVDGNQALAASRRAGGIFIADGSVALTDTEVRRNTSQAEPGGIYNQGQVRTFGDLVVSANAPANCRGSQNPVPGCVD
ncbi:right-handed parallel beta-helix repeat-containing protein [Streptomyces sp. IBSNAI002]|uniref:right-handed parallel beta-helix repeat-containing protein n=1 Tax=Streptomyces sp. IBSNAI002 TaxID=3457500 RepID=UPI003FD27D3C